MYDAREIQSMQQAATRKAARERIEPLTLYSREDAFSDWRGAPFIGNHRPPGWRAVRAEELREVAGIGARLWDPWNGDRRAMFFCDGSGWGSEDEPALTGRAQAEVACALYDWATRRGLTVGAGLLEVGQFQVIVGVFVQLPDYWRIRKADEDRRAARGGR